MYVMVILTKVTLLNFDNNGVTHCQSKHARNWSTTVYI